MFFLLGNIFSYDSNAVVVTNHISTVPDSNNLTEGELG
jgi:hypothetical protein